MSSALWAMHWDLPVGVQALCTTRVGGVSQPPFDSLNLGDHVHDDEVAVQANRERLQQHMAPAHPVFLKQVHGVEVAVLTSSTPQGWVADACVTTYPNVACTIMVADCMPLLFTDRGGQVVAAAHAGWRGLAAGVIEQTVATMCQQANVAVAEIQAWLGPCIGPTSFEVGEEVREAFVHMDANAAACFVPHPQHPSKWLANLPALAHLRLHALGITALAGNDGTSAWCTVMQSSRLFSFRRDGVTGRFAACIWRSAA